MITAVVIVLVAGLSAALGNAYGSRRTRESVIADYEERISKMETPLALLQEDELPPKNHPRSGKRFDAIDRVNQDYVDVIPPYYNPVNERGVVTVNDIDDYQTNPEALNDRN